MWLWIGFRRVLVGFWRLLIGIVIGAVFYVWMFFNYKQQWESIHEYTHDFLSWMVTSPYLADYSQWNTLLNLDDKLAFALFIMVGRIMWLMFEAVLFTFPLWLFNGRNKQKKTANSPELAPIAPKRGGRGSDAASVRDGTAPVMGHSGADNTSLQHVAAPAAAISASSMAREEQAGSTLPNGQVQPPETSENLERSIDETLQRIKKIGEQNSNN
ncbi:MAG: hypothetical protein GY927_09820 [bacterium]|nr:hypothetical protein [bacterium]